MSVPARKSSVGDERVGRCAADSLSCWLESDWCLHDKTWIRSLKVAAAAAAVTARLLSLRFTHPGLPGAVRACPRPCPTNGGLLCSAACKGRVQLLMMM